MSRKQWQLTTELAIAPANPAADWGVVVPISHSAVQFVDSPVHSSREKERSKKKL